MVYYLDTSALVKRYVAEQGSQWVRNLCQPASGNIIMTVSITKVETAAALAIKLRQKGISTGYYNRLLQALDNDFTYEYRLLSVDIDLVNLAVDLTKRQKLRGYDAVQLAAAVTLQNRLTGAGLPSLPLIAADGDLLTAAQNEGLSVDNPNLYP